MTNKAKRNLSLAMMILAVFTLIGLIISRIFFGIHHTGQFIAAPLLIYFFGMLYRNFSLAVKEDKKYGNIQ